jgi:hypothetical protein
MSRPDRKNSPEQVKAAAKGSPKGAAKAPTPLGPPRDVVDGIPDRTARPRAWMYLLLAAVFLGWVIFLVLVKVYGSLQ